MKNQEIKQWFQTRRKRAFTLFLTVTTSFSLTACSLDFTPVKDSGLENLDDEAISQLYEELGDELERADFNDEESLNALVDSIIGTAEATERVEDVEFQKATLVRVVDGDTIVVSISGEEYHVRLIGVNTPESVAPEGYRTENSAEGITASDYVKELLSDVKTVYLQTDVSDTDQYGRLLRYVWLEVPDNPYDIEEVATKMLNGILVLEKIAEPAIYEPDTAYADYFEELEYR